MYHKKIMGFTLTAVIIGSSCVCAENSSHQIPMYAGMSSMSPLLYSMLGIPSGGMNPVRPYIQSGMYAMSGIVYVPTFYSMYAMLPSMAGRGELIGMLPKETHQVAIPPRVDYPAPWMYSMYGMDHLAGMTSMYVPRGMYPQLTGITYTPSLYSMSMYGPWNTSMWGGRVPVGMTPAVNMYQ